MDTKAENYTTEHGQHILALAKAFSGHGVDEKQLITTLSKATPQHIQSFRKAKGEFFHEDERQFERWIEDRVQRLHQEFIRFKNAVVLRTMHPWERDARLLKEALVRGPQVNVVVETACTRSSDELLGARKAYHSLFHHSLEEDIATSIHTIDRKLLVALVSAYRYEGAHVKQETAKSDAKFLHEAIKVGGTKDPIQEDKVVYIIATSSKPHLKCMYNHYTEITGKSLDEDLEGHIILKQAIQCLCMPATYFSKVLEVALENDAEETAKDAVTRVILTQVDGNMNEIKEEYLKNTGTDLSRRIEQVANGSYRDFLLALIEEE